ncbi:hypothetical protein DYB28_005209 [Aphanomyces astaci]|uniref:Uncharacterized protein n=1 Tax=Aphanomyces astaci TaxID=112090 RepID=A0A9X8DWL5_APHAT|nr:hypothetical protein DYB28_005209 [Aphanomyces astaci]
MHDVTNGAVYIESMLRNTDWSSCASCWGTAFDAPYRNELHKSVSGLAWLATVQSEAWLTVPDEARYWTDVGGISQYTVHTYAIENALWCRYTMRLSHSNGSFRFRDQTTFKMSWGVANDLLQVTPNATTSVAGRSLIRSSHVIDFANISFHGHDSPTAMASALASGDNVQAVCNHLESPDDCVRELLRPALAYLDVATHSNPNAPRELETLADEAMTDVMQVRVQFVGQSGVAPPEITTFALLDRGDPGPPRSLTASTTLPSPSQLLDRRWWGVQYDTAMLLVVLTAAKAYIGLSRGHLEGQNMLELNGVARLAWVGRPFLCLRGVTALMPLSTATLELTPLQTPFVLRFVSPDLLWSKTILGASEATWLSLERSVHGRDQTAHKGASCQVGVVTLGHDTHVYRLLVMIAMANILCYFDYSTPSTANRTDKKRSSLLLSSAAKYLFEQSHWIHYEIYYTDPASALFSGLVMLRWSESLYVMDINLWRLLSQQSPRQQC